MAYKYSKGKTFQGDIYNEDDAQRNTYIDFGADDYIGLVASGSSVLVVSGSKVGIGTETPAYTLDVQGYISIGTAGTAYIVNNNDTNTHIKLGGSGVPGLDGMTFTCGGKAMLTLDENGLDTVSIGTSGDATDFKVMTANTDYALYVSGGVDRVGIGTSTPVSTLDVSGSLSAKIVSITGTSNTIGATHTVLMGADDGVCTAQLPAAANCIGRIYIFKRLSAAACTVESNGSETIEGSPDDLKLENLYDAYTIQCDGTGWWVLGEWFNGI